MRIALISILISLCLPMTMTYCSAETALGGLHVDDNLATIWKTMQMPEMIQARRRNGPEADQAVLAYKRQGAAVYVGLTPYGDKMEHMLTESAAVTTNDGIKVGDPRSTAVSKRGEPEEMTNDQPGITECWYWSQGLNFAVNDKTGSILNIFIFPPMEPGEQLQQITVPEGAFEISHEYTDQQTAIIGRVSNKSDKPQYDVRVGITLYDKDRRVVDVVVSQIGCLMPGTGFPFKAGVPRKGQWTEYSVDFLAQNASDDHARQLLRTVKSALAKKGTIVLPVAGQAKPE